KGIPQIREEKNDQVDCCCWLCLIISRRNFGASNNASAYSSTRWHDHASSLGMRPRQDSSCWCLRGQNHHPPDPPSLPQGLPQGRLLSAKCATELAFDPLQSNASSP